MINVYKTLIICKMSLYKTVATITTEEQLTDLSTQIPEGCLDQIEDSLNSLGKAKPIPVEGNVIEKHLSYLIKSKEYFVTCDFTEDQLMELIEEFSKFQKIIESIKSGDLPSVINQTQKERIKINLLSASSEIGSGISKIVDAFSGKDFGALFDF